MAVLAEARVDEIEQGLEAGTAPVDHVELRATETGLVMLRGRIGGDGDRFNVGEAILSDSRPAWSRRLEALAGGLRRVAAGRGPVVRPATGGRVARPAASPDSSLQVALRVDTDGRPEYSIKRKDRIIVNWSRLGFNLANAPKLDGAIRDRRRQPASIDDTWEQPWGERRYVRNHYRELRVEVAQKNRPPQARHRIPRLRRRRRASATNSRTSRSCATWTSSTS